MALLHENGLLFYDSQGNIHQFVQRGDRVESIYWEKNGKDAVREMLWEGIRELRGCIQRDDTIRLFCIDQSDQMSLYTIQGNQVKRLPVPKGDEESGLRDGAVFSVENQVVLLYTCQKKREEKAVEMAFCKRRLAAVSLDMEGGGFEGGRILTEFETGLLPSEVAVRQYGDVTYICLIEKRPKECSILVLRHMKGRPEQALVRILLTREIFWYDFCLRKGKLLFAYTVREEGMFSIKALIYDPETEEVSEEISVCEKTSCTHPVFEGYQGGLWLSWFEEGSVHSRVYQQEKGFVYPYKWKETIGKELLFNEIHLNDQKLKERNGFDLRRVFCLLPENQMTGFGKILR